MTIDPAPAAGIIFFVIMYNIQVYCIIRAGVFINASTGNNGSVTKV